MLSCICLVPSYTWLKWEEEEACEEVLRGEPCIVKACRFGFAISQMTHADDHRALVTGVWEKMRPVLPQGHYGFHVTGTFFF